MSRSGLQKGSADAGVQDVSASQSPGALIEIGQIVARGDPVRTIVADRHVGGVQRELREHVVMEETDDDHLAEHPDERLVIDVHLPQMQRALDAHERVRVQERVEIDPPGLHP